MTNANTGVSRALTRALRREIDGLAYEIARARRGEASGVHRARVASRRLREALPLIATMAAPDRDHLERTVRGVTRALGGVREMDVARELLQKIARADHWRPAVLALLDRDCARVRRRREKAMLAKIDPAAAGELSARLMAMVTSIEHAARGRTAAAAAASRVRQRAAALRRALAAAGTLYSAEPLHAVRIAAKKLRYALEIAHLITRVSVGREIRLIKTAQTQLGEIHDMQVLQARVQAVASGSNLDRAMSGQLAAIEEGLEKRCRGLHAKFLRSAPRVRAIADALMRDAVLLFVGPRSGRMARMFPMRPGAPLVAAGGHR